MDDGDGGHVEGEADAKGVGGEGSCDDEDGLNTVVEEKVGDQVVDDLPELLNLTDGVSDLPEGEGDGGCQGEAADGVVDGWFGYDDEGPQCPGEPPDAYGGDGDSSGEVFVGGVLGDEDEDQVDDEKDAAAGVPVGKAAAANVVPEVTWGDVGEDGVVEDEAAGEAYVGKDEDSQ